MSGNTLYIVMFSESSVTGAKSLTAVVFKAYVFPIAEE